MDSMMAVEIKQTLEREFNILFTIQEIRNLTFVKLIETSTKISDNNMYNRKELDTEKSQWLAHIVLAVKDEDFISQTYSTLSTKGQGTTTEVFLIPGVDGCGTTFNHLAPNILFSATSFHYNTSNINPTTNIISKKTDHLIKVPVNCISNLCYIDEYIVLI